jgi:hypothetical protein
MGRARQGYHLHFLSGLDFPMEEDYSCKKRGGNMASNAKTAWQILLVSMWINISETIRWMLYSKPKFDALYQSMGMELPKGPIHGILWMIWGIIVASLVFVLSSKLTLLHASLLSWLAVSFTTWIVFWNMGILPLDMLWVAVPSSLVEIFVAALISIKLQGHGSATKG